MSDRPVTTPRGMATECADCCQVDSSTVAASVPNGAETQINILKRGRGKMFRLARVSAGVAAAAFLMFAVSATSAAAARQTICPGGGLANTTVDGGLLVTNGNYCVLYNDTINGGVTVLAGSDIELDASTVNNGITVLPGGEIEANPGSVFGDNPTTSTVNGGITLNQPDDWDIETTTIVGDLTIDGGVPSLASPTFCGNTIIGSVQIANVEAEITWFGDPIDEPFQCAGNTISESLSLSNSSFFELEGNRIGGSVFLNASILEFNRNRIGGDLVCSNGTTIEPDGEPGDPNGNKVAGASNC